MSDRDFGKVHYRVSAFFLIFIISQLFYPFASSDLLNCRLECYIFSRRLSTQSNEYRVYHTLVGKFIIIRIFANDQIKICMTYIKFLKLHVSNILIKYLRNVYNVGIS